MQAGVFIGNDFVLNKIKLSALETNLSTWGDDIKGIKTREPEINTETPHMTTAYFLLWWLAKLKTFFLHFK